MLQNMQTEGEHSELLNSADLFVFNHSRAWFV